jgi:hypothetical protein
VKVVAGALAFTLAGALLGAAVGWVGNPKPVAVPEEGLAFVNYLGPIVGGAVGATFGLVLGGGWVAKVLGSREERWCAGSGGEPGAGGPGAAR